MKALSKKEITSILVTAVAIAVGMLIYSLVVKKFFSESKVGALGFTIEKKPRGTIV